MSTKIEKLGEKMYELLKKPMLSAFFFILAFHISMPVTQEFYFEKTCIQLKLRTAAANKLAMTAATNDESRNVTIKVEVDDNICDVEKIQLQREVSRLMMALQLSLLVPTLFTLPMLGASLDLYGRSSTAPGNNPRMLLLLSMAPFLGLLLLGLVELSQSLWMEWSPWWMLGGHLAWGFLGGPMSIFSLLFTRLIQTTPAEKRSGEIALMEGAIGVGGMVGSAISGQIRYWFGFSVVFLIILGFHVATFSHSLFSLCCSSNKSLFKQQQKESKKTSSVIQEGLQKEYPEKKVSLPAFDAFKQQRKISGFVGKAMRHMVDTYTLRSIVNAEGSTQNRRRVKRQFILLFTAYAVETFCFHGLLGTLFPFLRLQLGWNDREFGWYQALTSGLNSVAVLALYHPLQRRFGNARLVQAGVLGKIVNLVILALATHPLLTWGSVVAMVFGRYPATGMRAISADLGASVAGHELQGRIQAFLALMDGLICIISGVFFNGWLYPLLVNLFPGAVLLTIAGALLIPTVLIAFVDDGSARRKSEAESEGKSSIGSTTVEDGGSTIGEKF